MKIHLNLVDFNDDISPLEEIIDSIETSTRLIPFGKSGIHIKKENRGSFTSYCGGKVTDACIQKGKNSPSAAIRKKATFAANARKWKHQLGGTINSMIPLADRTDISNLFVDYDTPSNFTLKKLKEEEKKEDDLNLVDNLDYYFGVSPVVRKSKSNDTEKLVYPDDVYDGNPQSATSEQASPTHTSTGYYISSLDFNIAKMSDLLRQRLSPHIGKESGLMGSGVYDCSDFVRKVYSDYGLNGSSRSIYNLVDHVDTPQEGDLIFVYGTLGDENKIGHVGIVTNADDYTNGFLEVALGTPSKTDKKKYTGLRTYDLNNPWFTNHRVVYGRLRPKATVAKYGMKFLFGGFIPKHISSLFVSATPKQKTRINYDALFKEDKSDKKENNNLSYSPSLNISQSSAKKVDNNKKENNLPTFVYSEPEKQNPLLNNYSGKGYNFFKSELEQYFKHDPDAKMYEDVLTRIAQHESNFNLSIPNKAGAPAYGWFLFWQDGQLNNITHYSGLNIEEFRYNPQAQISSAIKMARDIDRSWTSEDLRLAKQLGYGRNSLLRGAWLGGIGGVRQVLKGLGNPSDGHWYNGQGRTVKQAMDEEKLNN